jgi:hypothetical protein
LQLLQAEDEDRWAPLPLVGSAEANNVDVTVKPLLIELGAGGTEAAIKEICWSAVIERRPKPWWDHGGKCACGKKAYFSAECRSCGLADIQERQELALKEAADR